jgi:signal transduction histidine kinase
MMPGLDGWEFRVLQRAEPRLSEIPVVAMSANRSAQAAAIDANAFLRKPVDAAELLSTAQRLIAAARQRTVEAQQAELERLSALGMIAAGVAHDINNPLTIVFGNLSLAREHLHGLEPADAAQATTLQLISTCMEHMDSGAQRIADIVRSVSDYSRSETTSVSPVSVVEALEAALRLVENELRHRATLARHYGPVPQVRGNASKLAQAFLGLITHAIHSADALPGESGKVWVATATGADGSVEVTIGRSSDDLAATPLAHAYDRSYSAQTHGSSMGLSLAISHRIIAAMGGAVSMDSGADRGCAFRVRLPRCRDAARNEPRAGRSAPLRSRAPRVLVVDDEPMMCDILSAILGDDYDVSTQVDARAALSALLSGESYDAILCDLMMPGLSGYDLHAEVAKTRPDQAARMVFMTGGTFTEPAQRFLDARDAAHLEKPFRPQEVVALMERHIHLLGVCGADQQRSN